MAAEYTAVLPQTVAVGGLVTFTDTAVSPCSCYIHHRDGSGTVTLKGRGRYHVTFGANASVGTAASAVSMAIAIDGEPLGSATMIVVSVAANNLNNISAGVFIDVPCNCCYKVSVVNTGTLATTIQNANMIVEKVG